MPDDAFLETEHTIALEATSPRHRTETIDLGNQTFCYALMTKTVLAGTETEVIKTGNIKSFRVKCNLGDL